MPIWFGNALGSAIGLLALLLGALYNASLARKRDTAMKDAERAAISAAIGAEMAVYLELVTMRFGAFYDDPEHLSAARLESFKMAAPTVWPKLAGKVGMLPADLAHDTVMAWALLGIHAAAITATVDECKARDWSLERVRQRSDLLKQDLKRIASTAERLTGRPVDPALEYALL